MKKGDIAELLGRRIRNLRRSKGLSQKELAKKSGLDLKLIRGVERGEADPSVEDLKKISEGLEAELIDLLRFKHKERDPSKIKGELLETINQVKDKEKLQLLLEILRALK